MMRKVAAVGVLSALATLMFVSFGAAQSQPAPAAPAGGNQGGGDMAGRGGFGPGNFDPAMIRQMMDESSRQNLEASPEEWKVLGPRFNKVQTLSRSLNGGATGMLGMFGMGRGGMGMAGGQAGTGDAMTRGLSAILGEPTALDKARDNLFASLGNNSPATEIQTAIKTFRDAREKARKELIEAQADLRKICSVKQEGTLIAMGMLD